ncbi:hypothetical protein DSO57_1016569 [Entomophthora muscae]|uniref:Uncharacterized protein n=1 Tax=Entomophthora muscae TaxID=34485 RepID=A0ACC2RW38_9FUNG|nr:hypothetical protein DSO57_1016569 [Entomophthora muscae]
MYSLWVIFVAGLGCVDLVSGPLKIAIHSSSPSKSHVVPILEISEVLIARGHSVTFAAHDNTLAFIKGYSVEQDSFGFSPGDRDVSINSTLQQQDLFEKLEESFKLAADYQRGIYAETISPFLKFLRDKRPDVIICDHAAPICLDLANAKGIPLVISLQALGIQDWEVASYLTANFLPGPLTTRSMTIRDRARDLYNKHFRLKKLMGPVRTLFRDLRREYQLAVHQPIYELSNYGLTISCSFVGFEPAQPLDPRSQLIGPIISSMPSQKNPSIAAFLNSHRRVLYIASGSMLAVDPANIQLLLQAALDSISDDVIDGLIWGLGETDPKAFPKSVAYNGKEILTRALFDSSFVRILDWAPQKQILDHKNTRLFISHGGLASCLEAINSQTPIIGMSLAFDQYKNIAKLVHNNIGQAIDHTTSLKETIATILEDKGGMYKANLQRMKILSHFGQRKLSLAADMVEEHAYLAKACRPYEPYDSNANMPPCELTHRIPAGYYMSYLRANNIDLYFLLLLTIATILYFCNLFLGNLMSAVGLRATANKRKRD